VCAFKSIYFKGYKSFDVNSYTEVSDIKNVNVIIGKNNSGKSSVIDMVEYVLNPKKFSDNKSRFSDIELMFTIGEEKINQVFQKNSSGGGIPGNHYDFGQNYIGKDIRASINTNKRGYGDEMPYFQYIYSEQQPEIFNNGLNSYWNKLANSCMSYMDVYQFRRLDAERNIIPEMDSENENLQPNGDGACNLIRKFINFSQYDEKLIENILLEELNRIMYPEANFSNIRVQQVQRDEHLLWEVFLEEKDSGRFALSQSGSGLKTIILILLNLLIIPETKEYKGKKVIYAFEEIENNLHPALQRRVFDYLYEFAADHNIMMFLTTHSHVAINTYYGKACAQIFHVTKENSVSTMKLIDNYVDKVEILNDLDVRASDLLQSNGIIWVEGPSDRIYIKKWLEVFCNCKFEEGKDYQFLYYGGRLLSHYTADHESDNLINVLLTNHNAAIIIDSDKKSNNAKINNTKKRVKDEFNKNESFCWITKGKEIENYVPKEAIEKSLDIKLKNECGQYELFPDFINVLDGNFASHKVEFATKIISHITYENSKTILDLNTQIRLLYNAIMKWNNAKV
jgi:predicted ATP-dependent endonuclease of OLD family